MELAGLLHELSIRLLGADGLPQALTRLAGFAAGAMPGAVRCSVALIGERTRLTHAASGPRAQAEAILDESDERETDLDAAPDSFLEHRTADQAAGPDDTTR